jgi:hypothetical protein
VRERRRRNAHNPAPPHVWKEANLEMAKTQKTVIVTGCSHEFLQDIFGKEKNHCGLV